MEAFLYFVGFIVIIASVICAVLSGPYALLVFPVIIALGSIILGIAKIISLLEDLRNRKGN